MRLYLKITYYGHVCSKQTFNIKLSISKYPPEFLSRRKNQFYFCYRNRGNELTKNGRFCLLFLIASCKSTITVHIGNFPHVIKYTHCHLTASRTTECWCSTRSILKASSALLSGLAVILDEAYFLCQHIYTYESGIVSFNCQNKKLEVLINCK